MPVAERKTREESRASKGIAGVWIGHYGCGRLVKCVAYEATGLAGRGWALPKFKYHQECPACGFTHIFKVMWRRPIDVHEAERAELTL